MISPTVGRVVLFTGEKAGGMNQPNAALVTYVWSDRMVNLAVFDANGIARGETSVTLVQEGDEYPKGRYCEWIWDYFSSKE